MFSGGGGGGVAADSVNNFTVCYTEHGHCGIFFCNRVAKVWC